MNKILRHRFFSGLLLAVIYGLHLGLFNLMMNTPFQTRNDQVQWYTHISNSKNTCGQSLAALYQRILKHEDAKKHHFVCRAVDISFLVKLFIAPDHQPSGSAIADARPVDSFHLPDDAYKRYRLINVFLI